MSRDEGFILLPLAGEIREGALHRGSTHVIKVLVALAAHENHQTRLAFPSLNRLAVLAGIRKANVTTILSRLVDSKWTELALGPRGRRAWKMLYAPYPGNIEPRDWLRINRTLVTNGTWAAMSESARRLYLVMKALAWVGQKALPDWSPAYEENEPGAWEELEAQFFPAMYLDPSELCQLAGLTPPTFRRAKSWLIENRLAVPTSGDLEPGLLLPHAPGTSAPGILEQLERDRAEAALPRGAALRAFRAAQKAERKLIANQGGYRRTLIRESLNAHKGTV